MKATGASGALDTPAAWGARLMVTPVVLLLVAGYVVPGFILLLMSLGHPASFDLHLDSLTLAKYRQ